MKSLKQIGSQATSLTQNEMLKTKGGNSFIIEVGLDICVINPVTGVASLLYCDRRKKRVNA
jgi:hypothetical protein